MNAALRPLSVRPEVVQMLGTMLSDNNNRRRLPYAEDQKALVRAHVLELLGSYPNLKVEGDNFVTNDGAHMTCCCENSGGLVRRPPLLRRRSSSSRRCCCCCGGGNYCRPPPAPLPLLETRW